MSGGYFRCWLQACGAVDRFVVVFFISPSKMGLWWFTLAALLLIIFLIDAAKKEDFFFPSCFNCMTSAKKKAHIDSL